MTPRQAVHTVVRNNDQMKEKTMTTIKIRHALAGVLMLCAVLAAAAAAKPVPQTAAGDPLDPRTTDPAAQILLTAPATGVQKYTCQPNGTWLFTDPVATLFRTSDASKPIVHHFLDFATGQPVWQFKDGSSVEATRAQSASGGAGNIALLLLKAVTTAAGPDGDRFESATWVQRLNTSGGVAPAGSCTAGDTAAVPYTADYYFWKQVAAGGHDPVE